MRKAPTLHAAYFALAAATAMSSCASRPTTMADGTPSPRGGDDGIVIAESHMSSTAQRAPDLSGKVDDCIGPGLGVIVAGSTKGATYLYDANGEPCESAEVLFDGRTRTAGRPADPAISLRFHDSFGPTPNPDETLPPLKAIPNVKVSSELLKKSSVTATGVAPSKAASPTIAAVAKVAPPENPVVVPAQVTRQPAPPPKPDPLVTALNAWQAKDAAMATRSQESDKAAARDIEKIARDTKARQDEQNMAMLSAKLRERERQIQEEQRRHTETMERAQEGRAQTEAARQAWQSREDELQTELAASQARLAQFEQLTSRLKSEQSQKEKAYQEKISNLSNNLEIASKQADESRRNLVLKAAAKIAEAEELAKAAQLQEQEIKLAEAARLKSEAETMLDRALAIKAGQQVMIKPADAAPMPLDQVPVVLHAKNQGLEDLLQSLLTQAEPQAGKWTADWQLTGKSQYLLKEKWSLTAEAPLQDVLAQLAAQVKKAHGITLTFSQFSQSRLLVVTDTPQKAVK